MPSSTTSGLILFIIFSSFLGSLICLSIFLFSSFGTGVVLWSIFSPSTIIANSEPTSTVAPSDTTRLSNMPEVAAGTSNVTLSVSNSTIGSSTSTNSPCFLIHLETVASTTDSPKTGTKTSIPLPFRSFFLVSLFMTFNSNSFPLLI